MKKFRISYSELVHYESTIIDAKDKDEADEIFREMLDNGDIEVNETECEHFDIDEIIPVKKERKRK
jgi:uncharacterized membrane protein